MTNSKNIIICCDGTSNAFGQSMTNVVKAYSVFDKRDQHLFYDPGVGTTADIDILSRLKKRYVKTLGLALGYGLQRNIHDAYSFLMNIYEPGDRVFLFGFSRGAYTVKVLAGIVHMCGLLDRGNEQLIPYAYELYTAKKTDFALLARFKDRFSRSCSFHFMGIWDSVSSVGSIGNMRNYPYTSMLRNVAIVRHAVAIDERRAYYRNNQTEATNADVQTVWFAGVHSDVGGGQPEASSAYSKIPLMWILGEAEKAGVRIDRKAYDKIVLGRSSDYVSPNALASLHGNSWWWFLLEIIPRKRILSYKPRRVKWYLPLRQRRTIPDRSLLHRSVDERMRSENYRPPNIPETCTYID